MCCYGTCACPLSFLERPQSRTSARACGCFLAIVPTLYFSLSKYESNMENLSVNRVSSFFRPLASRLLPPPHTNIHTQMNLHISRVVLAPPCFDDIVDCCGFIYEQCCCWVAVSVTQANSTRQSDTQMNLYASRVVFGTPMFR
jgi:hypothetical protein